ncbi:MAG: NAD-dependent malic enzyme [Gammaproteobacteria bacterium]
MNSQRDADLLRAPRADESLKITERGQQLIRDPILNKGSAFTDQERRQLGLDGLLPARVNQMSQQQKRVRKALARLTEPLNRYIELAALAGRNEQLFYRVLVDDLETLMPIVYTPTVGLATRRFSHLFRGGRGVWITPAHRGRIAEVLASATQGRPVKLIVATDNESILGIGDQGAGGIAISAGKLALYCAAGGIYPAYTLPVSLDVGTNNVQLLEDELYVGWQERRLRGEAYDSLIEEFVEAVKSVFPGALLQWEDFRKDNAARLLKRYRDRLPSFNDDIQGTGAVVLAGVLAAMRRTESDLGQQRVVVLGAGAAGLGIAQQLDVAIRNAGGPKHAIAVLDSRGLLVENNVHDAYKAELAWPEARAAEFDLSGEEGLKAVVEKFQPTVLIGASGQAGVFTEGVVRAMASACERPLIMPLSNPTDQAEGRPEEILRWSDGRAQVATGSPFADVELDGKTYRIGQGNNVFIFPGLGLGALLSRASVVTDGMIAAAANALAEAIRAESLEEGRLYPRVSRLRECSGRVAVAVMQAASEEGVGDKLDPEETTRRLNAARWDPAYPPYQAA